MKFDTILNFPNLNTPARAYFSIIDNPVYGKESPEHGAIKHVLDILRNGGDFCNYDFLIPFISSSAGKKVVSLFAMAYAGPMWTTSQPKNPEISAWIFENGVYKSGHQPITTGDGLVILGREEEHRRKCSDILEFARLPPRISGIEKVITSDVRE